MANHDQEISLFPIEGGKGEETVKDHPLHVVHANFQEIVTCDYKELFDGFDELHALTYSIGLQQVESVMHLFKTGEVIIGSPSQIHARTAKVFARQQYDIDYFLQDKYLQQRVTDGSFHLYVTTGSHDKLYLLKAQDGRTRVIMGSANFSVRAWDASQLEGYVYMDEPECYAYYRSLYDALREDSTDEIGVDAEEIREDGSNLEKLPALRRVVQYNQAIVIHDVPEKPELEYAYQITKHTEKWQKVLNTANVKPEVKPDGANVVVIDPKQVYEMKQYMQKMTRAKKEKQIVNPEFVLHYEDQSATFVGKQLDLHPDKASIQRDIKCLNQYMEGTKAFTGNTAEMRSTYWKILLYMFTSPFIALLRYYYQDIAAANSVGRAFPMFMLLRGPKNGGKSSVVKTIQQLMFGRALPVLPSSCISPQKFIEKEPQFKGCPILIDDVDNSRFTYFKDIVKSELPLLREHCINHSCFILTTNEAERVLPEVAKRIVLFQIPNRLSDDSANRQEIPLHRLQKQMGTALYREFLRRMFPQVISLANQIETEELPEDFTPDIFKPATQTLMDIFKDNGYDCPPDLHLFTWSDFMGEVVKAEKVLGILRQIYALAPNDFHIDKEKDLLLLDLKQANLEKKEIDALKNELPVACDCHIIGFTLRMNWSIIKEYTGIDSNDGQSFLQKLSHWFRRE